MWRHHENVGPSGECMFMHKAISSNPISNGTMFCKLCIIFEAQIAVFLISTLIHAKLLCLLIHFCIEWYIDQFNLHALILLLWLNFELWLNFDLFLNFHWPILHFEWCCAIVTYPVHDLSYFRVATFVCCWGNDQAAAPKFCLLYLHLSVT